MWKLKPILLLSLLAFLISSCELLGIGGKNNDGASGGEVVWKVENQAILTVSTQPAIDEKRAYFIQDARLKAYSLEKGNHIWSKQICTAGRNCDYSRTILQTNERLFIDQGFQILAIGKSTGNIIWKTDITNDATEVSGIKSPVLSQDADYMYAGRRGYVLKVRKEDGQVVRRYPLDRLVPEGVTQGVTEPIISPFGDEVLYVPTSYYDRTTPGEEEFGGTLFAFNASTGEIIWERRLEYKVPNQFTPNPSDSGVVSPPIYDIELTDSSIVILQGLIISVVDRESGDINWFKYFPNSGFDVGLAVSGNAIYAASVGTIAYRINLQTGDIEWDRDIRNSNTSIPTVQDGRLYFTNSGGGDIWVLDTRDGSVIYNEKPPGHSNDSFDVYISSLGVGEGYMVNVGSKAVYCLKVP